MEWRPILDCNKQHLSITPLSSDVGSRLATKPFTGDVNQMWRFIKNNLITLIFNHLQKSYNKSICRLNYKGFKQYSLLNVFSV